MRATNTPANPPNVNPNDVAVYLEMQLTKTGTPEEIAIAKSVDDATRADPAVRAYVEQLERLIDPSLHPQNYPSNN